jgi:Na+-translocating ferredoxin:NAD+ oxidoreductase RnfC subunit
MLIKRLNVQDYDVHTPYNKEIPSPSGVKIFLKQHIGERTLPKVKIGDRVEEGDLIAEVPENKLGAHIHASIAGQVSQVTEDYIRINK